MDRKILASLMLIALVSALAGVGLRALFSDTETSSGNRFTATYIDLKVDGKDDPYVVTITLSNMKPGDISPYYKWVLKNAGPIAGKLSVTFVIVSDYENGENEPEEAAEDEPYGKLGARPTLGDPNKGELSEFLAPGIHPDEIPLEVRQYLTIIERNDEEGWWIGVVSEEVDTGGTCGWGPKGWNVPSTVISQWAVGPKTNYGYFGLLSWNGTTFTYGILNPGDEIAFFFRVKLAHDPNQPHHGNLRAWDGTQWWDVNDNVIQGDSVTLNIIFKLEQVP